MLVAGLKQEAYVALGAARRTSIPTDSACRRGRSGVARRRPRLAAASPPAAARPAPLSLPVIDWQASFRGAGFAADRSRSFRAPLQFRRPAVPNREIAARAALAAVNYDLATTANTQVALAVGRSMRSIALATSSGRWRIVTARRPEARLWIVGDGPDRERFIGKSATSISGFAPSCPARSIAWTNFFRPATSCSSPRRMRSLHWHGWRPRRRDCRSLQPTRPRHGGSSRRRKAACCARPAISRPWLPRCWR